MSLSYRYSIRFKGPTDSRLLIRWILYGRFRIFQRFIFQRVLNSKEERVYFFVLRNWHLVCGWISLINASQILCLFDSVDELAERIDTSIQQAVNPALEQLSNKAHNVRESLGIWNRPFSPISSGHPNPVAAPNTNVPAQKEGSISLKIMASYIFFYPWRQVDTKWLDMSVILQERVLLIWDCHRSSLACLTTLPNGNGGKGTSLSMLLVIV